ncbi:unnamed protein product [Amoebophrya sp. A25]|nr:unnamed protein product [Amoebophrya sp. A25]|eukprot:GSA25T00018194001.1
MSEVNRSEALLIRRGRGNATSSSRRAIVQPEPDLDGNDHDGASTTASRWSAAPSLHPSLAGAQSVACSEVTIGAGDETLYWDYQHRLTLRSDLGHKCRECRKPFSKIGEPITERRGSRIACRYHAACFSGYADPRSQARSSTHEGNLVGTQFEAAPGTPFSKMRTDTHFSTGGSMTGKSVGAQMAMGRLSFSRSSRGVVAGSPGTTTAKQVPSETDPNALSASKLAALPVVAQGVPTPSHEGPSLERKVVEEPEEHDAGEKG